jgi:hypothetical protein
MRHILTYYPKLIPITILSVVAWVKALTDGQLELDADSLSAVVITILNFITYQVRQRPLPGGSA